MVSLFEIAVSILLSIHLVNYIYALFMYFYLFFTLFLLIIVEFMQKR